VSSITLFSANGVEARWNSTFPSFTVHADGVQRGAYRSEDAAVRAAKRFARYTVGGRELRIAERTRNYEALMHHLMAAENLSTRDASRRAFRILRGAER
jgi:hypothetical protein